MSMRERAKEPLRCYGAGLASCARNLKYRILSGVLNRVATAEMHHAALLLGYDLALGHGREGIFRYLDEFSVGTEIGLAVRYGEPGEREEAVEALVLELCLFG